MIDNIKPAGRRPAFDLDKFNTSESTISNEPEFKDPEVVASEEQIDTINESSNNENAFLAPENNNKKTLKDKLKNLTKKQIIIISAIALLVIIGGVASAYAVLHKKPAAKTVSAIVQSKKVDTPAPTSEASTLTGLQVAIGNNKLPVTGVMIENSPDARPQSGLKDAGVVFEAVAEGGITRFLALFQDSKTPDYIGPIRSVRPYYLDYLGGFDAAVAHVGGSGEALNQVHTQGIKDLDQFYNSGAYHRINERYAPHNVYSSIAQLVDLQKSKGFTSNYVGFQRKGKEAPAATPTAKTIDLTISGYLYNAHYDYNAATNSYLRSEGGKPHIDQRSGQQLNPKVVVVLVVPQGIEPDGIHTTYSSIGNGAMYIFQDGLVTQGIWEKQDRKSQLHLGDANGSPLAINAGQTWISLVGTAGSVSYKP